MSLLGPLEARIMRHIWSGGAPVPFVVRDVHRLMPELAYTTVMTTLNRLADKELLRVESRPEKRAHVYHIALTPEEFLVRDSREHVDHVIDVYGDVAIAAFMDRFDLLPSKQRERLRRLAEG